MPTPAEQLEQALGHTRAMLAAAEEGEWEHLARLQIEREPLLEQALADPASLGEAERALGAQVLQLNQELAAVAESARASQGDATRQVVRGRRAVRAYTRNES